MGWVTRMWGAVIFFLMAVVTGLPNSLSKGVEFAVYVGARGARMSAACPSVRMHERACCRAWSLRCLPCARRRDGGVGEVLPRLTTSHVLLLATRAARARDTN